MISRRRFIKACLAAVGLTALGGWKVRSWAGGSPDRNEITEIPQSLDAYRPGYLELEASGELERRERVLWEIMEQCSLCPRTCGVNRAAGRKGVCSSDQSFKVASHGPHFGEERTLVGQGGSGTIFFSDCNLLCVFCQNWQIAHRGDGRVTSHADLAAMMLNLQRRGCHNINLVTPTHVLPHIISALRIAIRQGLNIPLLYNSSAYETQEVMKLLDGVVDIYLPDFKFQDAQIAARFTLDVQDYPGYTAAAIKEMHRQVGTLKQVNGIAYRGLLIRHLVMPENQAGTDTFVRWVISELGDDTHVNIMGQYSPQHQARYHPPLNQRLTTREFEQALRWAQEAGLRNFH